MKMSAIAATALAALLIAGVAAVAMANQSHSQTNVNGPNNNGPDHEHGKGHGGHPIACRGLSTNETLTLSGLTGRYVTSAGNATTRGNASGSFNFAVGDLFLRGCTLTITGGSLTLGNATYPVTGGSLVLLLGGHSGVGSGTASSGSFLIGIAGLHGNSTSASVGAIRLDFKTGSSEYLIVLGSPESED